MKAKIGAKPSTVERWGPGEALKTRARIEVKRQESATLRLDALGAPLTSWR